MTASESESASVWGVMRTRKSESLVAPCPHPHVMVLRSRKSLQSSQVVHLLVPERWGAHLDGQPAPCPCGQASVLGRWREAAMPLGPRPAHFLAPYRTNMLGSPATCWEPNLRGQCPITAWKVARSALVFTVTLELESWQVRGATGHCALPVKGTAAAGTLAQTGQAWEAPGEVLRGLLVAE